MNIPEELTGIYENYESGLNQARKEAGAFAGAFNLGDDPRNHMCNSVFYEQVRVWAEKYAAAAPGPEQTAGAVDWILFYPAQHRGQLCYWYTYAAHQHALPLIPALAPEDAARLLKQYQEHYPKQDRLPVQQEVLAALYRRAGIMPAAAPEGRGLLSIWLPRVILLLIGLCIAHLGVTLFLLADLGSDPFNVMIQGIFRRTGLATHGTIHAAVSLLIVAVLLIVDRSYVRIGTFLCMLLGGPIIDVFTIFLESLVNAGSGMALRLGAVVLGCVILAFGMTIVIKSQAGTGPNDLVAVVISDKLQKKFGLIRILVDICFAAAGFLLGGTIGVGTLVCAALVGPVAQVFMPVSEGLCNRMLEKTKKV